MAQPPSPGIRVSNPNQTSRMAIFVHLTPEKNVSTILRTGITRFRRQDDHPGGIFAMPAARNFYVSHQWLAELKERGHLRVAGLYFHIPDSEIVWVGHYRGSHRRMTASEATALFIHEQRPRGFEVIVPRKIKPREIHRIHHLPQVFPLRRLRRLTRQSVYASEGGKPRLERESPMPCCSASVSGLPESSPHLNLLDLRLNP